MSKIKLGVTLYSFSTEYCKGIMTLEDCIRTAKRTWRRGIRNCFNPDDTILSVYQ